MTEILLTGSSGFIGHGFNNSKFILRHVVRSTFSEYKMQSCFYVDSISGKTNWDGAFDGVSSIIHLAGLAHSNNYSVEDYQDVNIEGTLKLAMEAKKYGVKRFVFVSSVGVNGTFTTTKPFSIKSELHPYSAFAKSKYEAELGLKKIALETGLEVVIVRPTLVYGPNAPGNFGALTYLVNKMPCLPFGLATNKRDFISINNLVDLLITCAKHPNASGHTFLASENETVSIKEFTNAIAKGLDTNLIQLPFPIGLMRFAAKLLGKSIMIEQLVGNLEVDSSNLKDVLDWVPPYTMEESMAFLKEKK